MVRIAAVLREAFMNHFSCFIKHGHLTTMFFSDQVLIWILLCEAMFNHVQLWRSWMIICHAIGSLRIKNLPYPCSTFTWNLPPKAKRESEGQLLQVSSVSVEPLVVLPHKWSAVQQFPPLSRVPSFCRFTCELFEGWDKPNTPPEGARGLRSLSSGWERGKLHLSLPRNFWVCRSGNWSLKFSFAFLARKLSFLFHN